MMRRGLVVACLALAVVVAPLAAPDSAAEGGRPRPRVPAADGPYDSGLTTFTASDPARGGRTLTFDVWYPTETGTISGAPASIDLGITQIDLPGVRRDADPARSRSGFPLVVYSHGSGGTRFLSWFLFQALANNGYVVIAPDHAGNTNDIPDPVDVVARNRPRDVSFAIDQALARSADRGDRLAGRIHPGRIAVIGQSFGGFTALAVAGGYQGWGPDERVDAIVPIAAASGLLSDAELAAVDVPTLLLAGTSDQTTPLPMAAIRPWETISAAPAWRVDIQRAGHSSFINMCELLAALQEAGVPPEQLAALVAAAEEGCAPELIPIDEAHRLTVHYVLSFLRTTIGHDARWQRFLSARYAERHHLPVAVFERRGPHAG
jgi:predicted dienelactone hydrolase